MLYRHTCSQVKPIENINMYILLLQQTKLAPNDFICTIMARAGVRKMWKKLKTNRSRSATSYQYAATGRLEGM